MRTLVPFEVGVYYPADCTVKRYQKNVNFKLLIIVLQSNAAINRGLLLCNMKAIVKDLTSTDLFKKNWFVFNIHWGLFDERHHSLTRKSQVSRICLFNVGFKQSMLMRFVNFDTLSASMRTAKVIWPRGDWAWIKIIVIYFKRRSWSWVLQAIVCRFSVSRIVWKGHCVHKYCLIFLQFSFTPALHAVKLQVRYYKNACPLTTVHAH